MCPSNQPFLLLFICCAYPNYNAEGALMIIASICSDFFSCFRSVCTIVIRTETVWESSPQRKSSLQSSHFCCSDIFSVRPTPKISSSSEIIMAGYCIQYEPCFQTIFPFLWLWWKVSSILYMMWNSFTIIWAWLI